MVFAKRMTGAGIAAVLALVLLAPAAPAAPLNERDYREETRKGNARQQAPSYEQRDARRPYFQRRENGEEHRPPRLSPDERRQLRRDIREAGREIYRPRR